MRKHLVKSAGWWFNAAKLHSSPKHKILAMENAYNHVENALAYILEKLPEAKQLFDETQNITGYRQTFTTSPPVHTQSGKDETDCSCEQCHELCK